MRVIHSIAPPYFSDYFQSHVRKNLPVIIHGLISDWPAYRKWNIEYLKSTIGDRDINVECGRLLSEGFYTKKMKADRFFESINNTKQDSTNSYYYFAQQRLDQFPELMCDINEIELYSSRSKAFDMIWIGPKGTITPLHFDRGNNLLAQVIGRKRVTLFPPENSVYLYARDENDSYSNFSNIDLMSPDYNKYPHFRYAQPIECEIKSNDTLYIPKGWWHFVESEETSISLNFFWQSTHIY